MEHSYILSILYEMALVIGGEVSVKPLLTKMLQRLLYHTSFPAGFVCLGVPFSEADSAGMIEVRIDAAVGDYELAGLIGQTVRLPVQLLLGAAERGEDAALLAALPDKSSHYKAFLRLPIDGQGVIVLLAPQLPDSDLPLTQLFQPVMANLSKAIVLCRSYDAYTGGLIAARDASQLALASSEEKFRAISAAVLDALIMVDDSSALVYWNPAAERILGYRADEVLGKPLHQLLTPQRYQSTAIQGFNAFRGTGRGAVIGKTIEIEALHKNGREIPIELSISALKLNGHWHAVGILRDITEKRRMEEELHQANVYNRSLIEASLDPLVTISAEGKITDVNRATEAATGRKRSELIGTDFSDYFTVPNKAREGYQQVFQNGYVTDYPLALRHRDGHVTDVLYNASVYRNEAGEVLGVFAAARDMTEHKRAEATRTQLAAIVESSNDAIIGKTPDGIITSWNKSAEKIYGYAADEIIGKPVTTLAPPSRHTEIHELLEKICQGGTVVNHESERIRKDGTLIHVALTLSPIRDASGNINGISTIARDITEKKRMVEELLRASVYNRSLIEASLDPLVTISPEGKITDVNRATESATGRNRSELTGTDFSDYFTEPDRAREGYQQVFTKGFVTDYPLALRHRDGHITDVLYNASVYRDEAGEVLGVFAAARDITERKLAEEQLRRSEHSLAEAQRIAHLGNWNLDLVKNVLTWSDEIYRIFEIDPEKFGASYDAFLNAIHPDDREPVNNAYSESLKSKTPYDIVHRLLMKDGRVKYVNEKCETHYGEDGTPLNSVGTIHDITERKRAEDEVKTLNRELEQRVAERTAQLEAANKELEAFAYSVSHDLRTPLRAIDGFSRILLDDYTDKLDDEGKRLLNVVRDNTSRMGQLIDDILKFSRVGRLEITYSEIDMEELTRAVCEELRPTMTGHEVQVEIEPLPPSTGDRSMMRQVLVNLLSNAFKFTRNKEGARIKVGSSVAGNEVIYFVQDNGVGFDMQYVDKLFGVFQRLHGVTEFEGTGIGLAIVKRVITRHGGRVWAEGKVNEGATIYFALPTREKEHG